MSTLAKRRELIDIDGRIQGIIFDCDGTLADTMPLHWQAWDLALAEFGIIIDTSFLQPFAGAPTSVLIDAINTTFSHSLKVDEFVAAKEKHLLSRLSTAKPIESVVEVVHRFRNRLPLGVVSGGSRKHVDITLRSLGIESYFGIVLTADDPIPPKPAPDLFLTAARKLEVSPQFCHVFEDADLGIAGALAAGMSVTDVRSIVF